MTSVVRFEEWQEPTGISAATVDGSGNVTFDNDVTVSGGATVSGDLTVTGNMTSANQGLVLVKTQTIGTAVSSVTVNDAFSSTYDNYRIIGYCDSGLSATGLMKLGTTATGYYWAHLNVNLSGTVAGLGGANDIQMEEMTVSRARGFSICVDIFGPYLSNHTSWVSAGSDMIATGSPLRYTMGWLNDTTSYTSFELYPRTGTITGGTIRVYGYNNG